MIYISGGKYKKRKILTKKKTQKKKKKTKNKDVKIPDLRSGSKKVDFTL